MSTRRSIRAALFALALAGCAVQRPPQYTAHFAAGDRAWTAGRVREAAEEYDRAVKFTHRPIDIDEALYRAGHAWMRAGDSQAALERWDRVAETGSSAARQARASFDAARLRYELGQRERAEGDLMILMRRLPDTGPARRAVSLALLERDEVDPTGVAGIAWIDLVLPQLRRTELESPLLYERAARLVRLKRFDEAVATYEVMLAQPYPANTRWDDGGYAYAQLLVKLNRPRDALRVIDRVLAQREHLAMVGGTYERPHFGDLQMLRARTQRDMLNDPRGAAESFHHLYADWPTSLLRDDALLEEAAVRESLHEDRAACALYVKLAREFPCTRRGRTGRQRATECAPSESLPEIARVCQHPHDGGTTRANGDAQSELEPELGASVTIEEPTGERDEAGAERDAGAAD